MFCTSLFECCAVSASSERLSLSIFAKIIWVLNPKFKDASCCSCSEKTVTSDEKNRFFDFFEKVVDI